MAEFGIHPYHRSDAPVADLVLVHGLKGNSRDTWTGKDDSGQPTYWPDWVKEQRPDVNIWLADYKSSLNHWMQPAMQLEEIGLAFLENAANRGLGVRPIHWVGHSMGGLIIKHLLCQARRYPTDLKWGRLSAHSGAITFLGTPHLGSSLAEAENYFSLLLKAFDLLQTGGVVTATASAAKGGFGLFRRKKRSHVEQLVPDCKDLFRLNNDFVQWINQFDQSRRPLVLQNFYETLPVFNAVTVVPAHSAQLPGASQPPVPVHANHFEICKFSSRDSSVFIAISCVLDSLSERGAQPISALPLQNTDQTLPSAVDSASLPAIACSEVKQPCTADFSDIAWRQALLRCSPSAQSLACLHLSEVLEGKSVEPDDLEQALTRTFENNRGDIHKLTGKFQSALWRHLEDSIRKLEPEEDEKLLKLYLMLLVRTSVLMCRLAFNDVPPDDLHVPETKNMLAIAVMADAVFAQGVWLTIGLEGVRVENIIDLAAPPDEHAQHPSRKSDSQQLIKEFKELLARADTHTEGERKMMHGRLAGKDWRPLLFDQDGERVTEAIRKLAKEFGMGIASRAGGERPQTVSSDLWQELCKALNEDLQLDIGDQLAVWVSRST